MTESEFGRPAPEILAPGTRAPDFAVNATPNQTLRLSNAQGRFWEMHGTLFEHQDALEAEDLLSYAKSLGLDTAQFSRDLEAGTYEKRVRDDFRNGVRSGVNGTPTFFVNGTRYDGSWANEEAFIGTLREAAREAGRGAHTTADA